MPYSEKQKYKPSNINYTSKDFSTIKSDLIEYTKAYFPDTYKDFNETSPGMMLIELASYVGDVLSYYIDYNYKENVLATATEKKNVKRLAEFLGYKTSNKTASIVRLKLTTDISADSNGDPVYSEAPAPISEGLQIKSNVDSEIKFETTGIVDFTISGSSGDMISAPSLDSDGLAESFTLTRYVRAVSGETKTKSFTITSPTKFLELDLGVDNAIEILNCKDSSGQKWYEVDYLAQQRILKERHYGDDSTRTTGYDQGEGISDNSLISIPYVLDYVTTNKKFVQRFDSDTNSTKLMFGNGLYRHNVTGSAQTGIFAAVEQTGLSLNGTSFSSINATLNELILSNNLNLGETPANTVITVTYRVGGGQNSNVQSGELTDIVNPPTGVSLIATNDEPSSGGTDGQTVDEIKQNASAFFSSQLRCVTREDYQSRILSLPAKFGNIAKCYVERLDDHGTLIVNTLSYNEKKQLVQTPKLVRLNLQNYLDKFRIINDKLEIGFTLDGSGTDVEYSGYIINFGVKFEVNSDKRFKADEVRIDVIDRIKDFFKIDKMQFRQSININDLLYNILGLEGVIGIKTLELFQDGGAGIDRSLYYYKADGEAYGDNDSSYGFQYNFKNALRTGVYRPSITPAVFELKNPNKDIYGKVL